MYLQLIGQHKLYLMYLHYFAFVNASNSTAKTINLPANPTANNYVVIKDKKEMLLQIILLYKVMVN